MQACDLRPGQVSKNALRRPKAMAGVLPAANESSRTLPHYQPWCTKEADAARLQRGPRVLLAQAGPLGDVHDQARWRRQCTDAHVLQRGRERAAPGAHRDEQARTDGLRRARVRL